MTIWLDAQLPPSLAAWLRTRFGLDAVPVRELGLRDAEDAEIFSAAKDADATVMTKDSDFIDLLERLGSPPRVIWLRCGNTSNARLEQLLGDTLAQALEMLASGEPLVEIGDAW